MKKIILAGFCLIGFAARSQSLERSVTGTSGNYFYVGGTGSLSFTVGENAVTTLTAASNILTQGFQQTDTSLIDLVFENDVLVSVTIFPNPVSNVLTCVINSENGRSFLFTVYDESGKLVSVPVAATESKFVFDVSNLAQGNYVLTVVDAKSKVSVSRKFIKAP